MVGRIWALVDNQQMRLQDSQQYTSNQVKAQTAAFKESSLRNYQESLLFMLDNLSSFTWSNVGIYRSFYKLCTCICLNIVTIAITL